jgi:hypothetical protein
MAILSLSVLPGWRLADPSQDLRGRRLLDRVDRSLGTITALMVNTETDLVESIVLDSGQSFPLRKLYLEGESVRLK